jgi:chlorobactene lauroyltransferase
MLTARKNWFLNKVLYTAVFLLPARSAFHGIYLRQTAVTPSSQLPVLAYANHSSWWDANIISILNERVWHRDAYVMMEDTQLQRYQFFRYMGAFSVNRRDARQAVTSMRYAINILSGGSNRMLLMFPQGEILHNDQRPLDFFSGVGHIARQAALCAAYPIALRYEFIGEQKPEVFISIGDPVDLSHNTQSAKELSKSMEQQLTVEMDRLHTDLIARNFTGFATLLSGTQSINRLWDALRRRPQIKPLGPNTW